VTFGSFALIIENVVGKTAVRAKNFFHKLSHFPSPPPPSLLRELPAMKAPLKAAREAPAAPVGNTMEIVAFQAPHCCDS
jgi:hypothetical protein